MLEFDAIERPEKFRDDTVKNGPSGGPEYDILGIGFGPSNLALAIALQEQSDVSVPPVRAAFLESKPQFGWHDGMILPETTMQISFLKDLVSLRNPTSSFSFLNYLSEKRRLADFINLQTFFPSRLEFHDYLSWAAHRVNLPVYYGTRAVQISWDGHHFSVETERYNGTSVVRDTVKARHLVVGAGIQPVLPEGVEPGARVFHNHALLDQLEKVPSYKHGRLLVVGSGQSAAEVVAYLHDTYPSSEVHASFRRFGYTPSDDSPYVNQIFDAEAVDGFYTAPEALKQRLHNTHLATNYSAVDIELIQELYRREYDEKVAARPRFFVHRVTEVAAQTTHETGVDVTLRDLGKRDETQLTVDAVIYATGFAPFDLKSLFSPKFNVEAGFENGLPRVARDYSLRLPGCERRIFLNGGVEHSHGLTSSLLSNVAIRAEDILRSALQDHSQDIPA